MKKINRIQTKTLVRMSLLVALSVILKLVMEIYVPIAGLPALRINFTAVPIIISGIVGGPLAGFIVGAVSDLMCFAMKPGGVYFPGFTLSSALVGLIPGLIYKYLKRDMNFNVLNTVFIILISLGFAGVFVSREVITLEEGILLYNGQTLSLAYPILFALLTAAYILIPIKLSGKVAGMRMDKILFTVSVTQLITSIIMNTYFLSILFGKGALVFLPGRIFSNYIMIPLYTMFTAVLLKSLNVDYSMMKKETEVSNVIQK